jgi:hypothetical protein
LAKNAPRAPGTEALIIHQVVAMFQVNIARYVSAKNFFRLLVTDSIHSKGIHATKINKVSGDTGQDAQRRRPQPSAEKRGTKFFKTMFIQK